MRETLEDGESEHLLIALRQLGYECLQLIVVRDEMSFSGLRFLFGHLFCLLHFLPANIQKFPNNAK